MDAVIAEAARVQLITDSASAVNVSLPASNTEAMLVGSVTGDLSLDMIPQDAAVQPGDVVLTSGLGGGYPANLLVGQVVSVRSWIMNYSNRHPSSPMWIFPVFSLFWSSSTLQPVDITPLIPTSSP